MNEVTLPSFGGNWLQIQLGGGTYCIRINTKDCCIALPRYYVYNAIQYMLYVFNISSLCSNGPIWTMKLCLQTIQCWKSPAMGRGIDSRTWVQNCVAKLKRLSGRYDYPVPTWFLYIAPIAEFKLPTQYIPYIDLYTQLHIRGHIGRYSVSQSRQSAMFLIPIMIIFKKNFFWVIIALFAILKCKCEKICTFSNILQKVKSYFFPNIYHSPFDSHKVWNIEAP